jgi:hypothetical protein
MIDEEQNKFNKSNLHFDHSISDDQEGMDEDSKTINSLQQEDLEN